MAKRRSSLHTEAFVRHARQSKTSRRSLALKMCGIGGPVLVEQLAGIADNVILIFYLSGNDLDLATAILAMELCELTGRVPLASLCLALETHFSQFWAAGEYHKIGVCTQRVIALASCINIAIAVMWLNSEEILVACGQDRDIATRIQMYARIRLPGQFASAAVFVIEKQCMVLGENSALLLLSILSLLTSIVLNACFIGSLKMGANGAALATTVTDVSKLVCLVVVVFTTKCRKCWIGLRWDALSGWIVYLKNALPLIVTGVLEESTMSVAIVVIGACTTATGKEKKVHAEVLLAAQAYFVTICELFYCFSFSIGRAISVAVGDALGGLDPVRAQQTARVGLFIVIVCVVCGSTSLLLSCSAVLDALSKLDDVSDQTTSGLEHDGDPALMRSIFVVILPLVVSFASLDAVQTALTGAIIGAGGPSSTVLITVIISYWIIGLATEVLLSRRFGLVGVWCGLLVASLLHVLSSVAVCFGFPCVRFAIDWDAACQNADEERRASITAGNGPSGRQIELIGTSQ
eukprot:TRINITY_DN8083_c0_g2_i1.p1 TRINITY_DN8083_c0_g2~~TRINITY_DN8083_c0_g2_i1.p1  ORF type:complete len:521 (-),score=53.11 TRINITY_DN8083_c0_g2_i1:54-1616(-)